MSVGPPVLVLVSSDAGNSSTYGIPVTAAAYDLILVWVSSYAGVTLVATPSAVTDDAVGLRWAQVVAQVATAANAPSLACWAAMPRVAFTSALTITFPLQQRGCAISVVRIPSASRADPVRLANRMTGAGTGTGTTGALPLPMAAPTHLQIKAAAHQANEATAPGGGFTELSDTAFTDAVSSTAHALEVAWKASDTPGNPSWASAVPWAVATLEIQEMVITAPDVQDPCVPVWLVEFEPPLVV